MKKSLILATSFAMALGVGVTVGAHHMKDVAKKADAAAHTFYFNLNGQSNLKQGNERYAAYHWKGEDNAWSDLTSVGGDFYSAELDPEVHDKIILARMNKEATENNWTNKWDQSGNLDYTASTVYFRATSESTDGNFTAEAYTPVYGLVGSFAGSSWDTDVPMTLNGVEATVTKALEAGDAVKVRADKKWDVSYGYSNLDNASKALFDDADGNASARAAGSYTFTLNFATGVLSAELNSAKHTVDVYVNGTLRGHEQVSEGALPADPELSYGDAEFEGWFTADDYKTKVTEITADCEVYGRVTAQPTVTYGYDISKVEEDFEEVYLYAFQTGRGNNHDWPGVKLSESTFEVPTDATVILNAGQDKAQTVNIEQLENPVANDVLEVLTSKTEGKYNARWASTVDEPAEDGYYICGLGSFKYKDAVKMTETTEGGNVAYYSGLTVKVDDEIRVRSYFDPRLNPEENVDQWATCGTTTADYGELHGDNFKFTKAGSYDIYAKYEDGFKFFVAEHVEPDIPAEDGYYICGLGSFRYEDATKMIETTAGGNVAYYSGLTVKVDDEIRVRSYFKERLDPEEDKDQWATCGTTSVAYGEIHNNNFKFSKAGSYDVYAKYEDGFKFFVAEHVDNFTIEMTAVKFNGKNSETEAMPSQLAYITADFEPQNLEKSGYVMQGVFEEEALETPYTPRKFAANGHLYVKYMKVGFYALSAAGEYKLENADPMMTEGIADTNKAEILLTVKENDCYSFVEYKADGTMEGQSGLGDGIPAGLATYESDEFGGHVKFLKDAVISVYLGKDTKVYLNEGLTAFLTNFISDVGGVCSTLDGPGYNYETYIANLQAAWGRQKVAFNALSDEEQKDIKDAEYGQKAGEDDLSKMINKYYYIVEKYGTSICEDFIWGQTIAPKVGNNVMFLNNSNNAGLIIIISVSAISIISIAAFLMLKKRKEK